MNFLKIIGPRRILILFVILNLAIGLFIVSDFSRSTDESPEDRRSNAALEMIVSNVDEQPITRMANLGTERYYGTAITTIFRAVERYVFPNVDHHTKVVAHYLYFVCFQAAVISLYFLGNYFFKSEWYSLFTAVLFGTQPLFFGHGFLNSKDIPIMAIFLLSVVLGFRMVDQWQKLEADRVTEIGERIEETLTKIETKKRERILVGLFLTVFTFIWSGGLIISLFLKLISFGYQTKGSGLIGKLFAYSTSSGSLQGYRILGFYQAYGFLRWVYLLTPIFLLFLSYYAWKNKLFSKYVNPGLFFAAAIWGMAVSTRILAVAAGGMVGLYALLKIKGRAFFPLVIYSIVAILISFVSWPYLWLNGFEGYFHSLLVFSDYSWFGRVLFDGQYYLPKELPARYVPQLMAIEFTEPLVILAVLGFIIGLYLLYRGQIDRVRLGLVMAWLLLPIGYAAFMHPTLYNGFRHLFFITPPLFIFAGLAFQLIAQRLKKPVWMAITALIILLPGVVGLIRLHPFQSMYFNSFAGGVQGAENQYDFPFLNTGIKQAMEYINDNVPPGSKLLFWKEDMFGRLYADNRYSFDTFSPGTDLDFSEYDYAIIPASGREQAGLGQYDLFYAVEADQVKIVYVVDLSSLDE